MIINMIMNLTQFESFLFKKDGQKLMLYAISHDEGGTYPGMNG